MYIKQLFASNITIIIFYLCGLLIPYAANLTTSTKDDFDIPLQPTNNKTQGMSEAQTKLENEVRILQGKLQGYAAVEKILNNKNGQLVLVESENKILRQKLAEMSERQNVIQPESQNRGANESHHDETTTVNDIAQGVSDKNSEMCFLGNEERTDARTDKLVKDHKNVNHDISNDRGVQYSEETVNVKSDEKVDSGESDDSTQSTGEVFLVTDEHDLRDMVVRYDDLNLVCGEDNRVVVEAATENYQHIRHEGQVRSHIYENEGNFSGSEVNQVIHGQSDLLRSGDISYNTQHNHRTNYDVDPSITTSNISHNITPPGITLKPPTPHVRIDTPTLHDYIARHKEQDHLTDVREMAANHKRVTKIDQLSHTTFTGLPPTIMESLADARKSVVECETAGVHKLVARSGNVPTTDTLKNIHKPHTYVNATTKQVDNHQTHHKPTTDLKHVIEESSEVSKRTKDLSKRTKTYRKSFEIALSEGTDSEEVSKRLVSLLKFLDELEEESSVLRGHVLALEKENKYLRKCVYHRKILDVNIGTTSGVLDSNTDSKIEADAELLKRYNESQLLVKQLTQKLATMKSSMQQFMQQGNINVVEKDRAVKELKRKYYDEKSRCQDLTKKVVMLEGKLERQEMRLPSSNPARTDSIVVCDLLSEINVLHQQMVLLTEDFKEERKDKSRMKTSQAVIERKFTELKTQVMNTEAQLQASESNLQDALDQNDQLQARINALGAGNPKSRKPLPLTPQSRSHSTPTPTSPEQTDLPGSWSCSSCTFINHPQRTVCELCGLLKKPPRPSKRRHTAPASSRSAYQSSTPYRTPTAPPAGSSIARESSTGEYGITPRARDTSGKSPINEHSAEGAHGISPQSSLWDMQEEKIRMYEKPYRLVPRSSEYNQHHNCDTLSFLDSKSF